MPKAVRNKGKAVQVSTLSTTEKLVTWTLRRKHISNALAAAIQFLLLTHTPVSRKVFQYFHFREIVGKHYLRADYRILYGGEEWRSFFPVVALVLFVFTFGLPSMIGYYLWIHRYELYSTSVVQRFGFLYSSFNRGAEFWQIHDVVLKMVLTGMLICKFCFEMLGVLSVGPFALLL